MPGEEKCPRTIGRICNVSPGQGERYYLRLTLSHITGPKCFADLRTVDGVVYPTFKESCKALGLLEDDAEWEVAMTEVSSYGFAHQVRTTFAIILHYCEPTDPFKLYETFKESMAEDFVYNEVTKGGISRSEIDMDRIYNQLLNEIDGQLIQMGGSLADHKEMPQPVQMAPEERLSRTFAEKYFPRDEMMSIVDTASA